MIPPKGGQSGKSIPTGISVKSSEMVQAAESNHRHADFQLKNFEVFSVACHPNLETTQRRIKRLAAIWKTTYASLRIDAIPTHDYPTNIECYSDLVAYIVLDTTA
jgi:hypothetical protein